MRSPGAFSEAPGRTARMPVQSARRPSRHRRSTFEETGGTAKLAPVSPKKPSISAETSMFTRSPAAIGRSSGMPWATSGPTEIQVAPGKP